MGGGEGVTVAVPARASGGREAPQRGRRHSHSRYALSSGACAARHGPGSTFWGTQQGVEQERESGAKQQRRAARSARPIDSVGIDARVCSSVPAGRRRGRRPGVPTGVIVCVRDPLGGP